MPTCPNCQRLTELIEEILRASVQAAATKGGAWDRVCLTRDWLTRAMRAVEEEE